MTERSIAADHAIRIADTYLRGASIERRKALATEILNAIVICEADFAKEVTDRLARLSGS